MIYRGGPPEPEGTPGRVAWCVSVTLHLVLLALLWLQSARQSPRAAAEAPQRMAGIVLLKADLPAGGDLAVDDRPADDAATPAGSDATVDERPQPPEPTVAAAERPPVPAETSDVPSASAPQASAAATGRSELPAAESEPVGRGGDRRPGSGAGSRAAVRAGLRGETTTQVFGVAGTGVKFVYLFDRSDSMHGLPLAALKQQLVASIESLRSVNQFFIFFFNHQVAAWDGGGGRGSFATDANKRAAAQFVRGISATGGTYRWDALRRALALHPDVIFFLTDTDNQMPEPEVSQAIERAIRAGIVIQSIEFGVGPGGRLDNFLRRLARETGGQYAYINTADLER